MAIRTTTIKTYRNGALISTDTVTWVSSDEQDNSDAIINAGVTALATNRAFSAIPAPTNAQVVAQVKALTRQVNGLIRVAADLFDGTD